LLSSPPLLALAAQLLTAKMTNGTTTAAAMRAPPGRVTFVKIIGLI
jgi:hypothetical protein